MLKQYCNGVACPTAVQLKLASFLYCFEGQHESAMSAADSCAESAGLSAAKVRACANDANAAAAAFATVQSAAAAEIGAVECFPWIEIEGKVQDLDTDHGCFGSDAATTPLLPLICKTAATLGIKAPAAC